MCLAMESWVGAVSTRFNLLKAFRSTTAQSAQLHLCLPPAPNPSHGCMRGIKLLVDLVNFFDILNMLVMKRQVSLG